MNRSSLDSLVARYAGFIFLFLAALYGLYLVRGAMPVFLIGGLIAYALEPLLQRLEKRGYSRSGAVKFVFLVYFLLFLLLLALLVSAGQQASSLPGQFGDWSARIAEIVTRERRHIDNLKLPPTLKKGISQAISRVQSTVTTSGPTYVENLARWLLGSMGTILVLIVLLPIVTLWFMMEANPIRARLIMLVPPAYRRDATEIAASINEILGRYVRGQMVVCTTFGVLCTIAFEVLARVYGMSYPLVLGVMAAVIYVIPYVGMGIITISAGLTAYLTGHPPGPCALAAVGCCVVFNLFVDYGVSPRVLGQGVGLHPLMVIFALLCGAQVGGPLGMVFAVPFFAALRVIAIYLFPQLTSPIPSTAPVNTEGSDHVSVKGELAREASDSERLVARIRR